MANEEDMVNQDGINVDDMTPAEKLKQDLSFLKNLSSADGMSPEQKQALNKRIEEVALPFIQSFSDQTNLSNLKDNYDLLKDLASKGFEAGADALKKMEEQFESKGLSVYDVINRNLNNEKQDAQTGNLKEFLSEQSNYGMGKDTVSNDGNVNSGNGVTEDSLSAPVSAPNVPQEQTVQDLTAANKRGFADEKEKENKSKDGDSLENAMDMAMMQRRRQGGR